MKIVLISILGAQNIPNIRFLKEKIEIVDEFVFIGTKEMIEEHKAYNYVDALNISNDKITQICVDPYSISSIETKLSNCDFDENANYIVNITGGTKPMSIASLFFFSSFSNVAIYFVVPEEGLYRQIFPRVKNPEISFRKKITLKEYFASYHLELIHMEFQPTKIISEAKTQMEKYIEARGDIRKLPNIKNAHHMQSSDDRSYYSGGWFEEYIYWAIKQAFNLSDDQIAFKVELKNEKSKNEYDVLFLYNDNIHIVECKAYFGSRNIHHKIEKDLYKLGALDDDFGLKAKAIYITTYNIKGYSFATNKSLKDRASSLKVEYFQFEDLINNRFLKDI